MAKHGYISESNLTDVVPYTLYGLKTTFEGKLLLRLHDAVCEWHALQPLALAVANVHVFGAVAHSHEFTA